MIYVCVVTMNPQNMENIKAFLPAIQQYDAQLWVFAHGEKVQALRPLANVATHFISKFRRYGCAEARGKLTQEILGSRAWNDDIFVYLDDDVAIRDNTVDWLGKLIAPIQSGDADIAGVDGRVIEYRHDEFVTQSVRVTIPDYVSGGWCAVHRRVFDAGVMFDPDYFPNYWEDVDFCLQARRKGLRIRRVGDIGLEHYTPSITAEMLKQSTYTHEIFRLRWTQRMIEVIREKQE